MEALDRTPVAVVTLRPDLTVLNANSRAKSLSTLGWFQLGSERFSFYDHRAQERLGFLVAAAPPANAAFTILDPNGAELAVLGARLVKHLPVQ